MATFSTGCGFILGFLFFVAADGKKVAMAEGGRGCSEPMGACGPDCSERCGAEHAGGETDCDRTAGAPICMCYYNCGPPPGPPEPKKCKFGLGVCSTLHSNSDCCSRKCIDRYPGLQAEGNCDSMGVPPLLCVCYYNC